MIRLNRGEEFILTSYDKWQIEVLQEAGYLLEDIQDEIARKTKQQTQEVKEAMEEAGVEALSYDDKIYKSVGLSPVPLEQSPYLIRLMQRNYEATLGEWKNFTRTTATASQQTFINSMDKAYNLVTSGAVSYTQAFKEVLDSVIDEGVKIKYPSGREDTIETATLRAVRTGVSQMSGQIQLARMDEMEVDLVLVSSHLGARPDHQVWQGKVYSRTGTGYPDFVQSTGYGTVTGLCGANCRHNFAPYFEGMENPFEHYDDEENQKQYELEQRQRTLERRIRDTKRQCINKKEVIDNCKDEKMKFEYDLEYQRKANLLKKQNEAYNQFCKENGLRPLNERIQVAKWNRQQAAAARGAAKRYETAHPNIQKKKDSLIKVPKTIDEANEIGNKIMKEAYENHRITEGLTSVSYEEMGSYATRVVSANYANMTVESANVFNETIMNLTQKYNTPLQKIRTMTKEEFIWNGGAFAYVSHDYTVDSAELVINPTKCKDIDKMKERIKELSEYGYCVKVPDEVAEQYIATHEFAHTLINLEQPLKKKTNWVNADYEKIKKARKDIIAVHDKYMSEVEKLTKAKKEAEFLALTEVTDENWLKAEKAIDALDAVKLSDYSLVSADEFMAEAFANAIIGVNKNKYSDEVMNVINKYFKR